MAFLAASRRRSRSVFLVPKPALAALTLVLGSAPTTAAVRRHDDKASTPAKPTPAAVAATPSAPKPALTWDEAQSALCASSVAAAEKQFKLPKGLLGTIAKVESGRPIRSMSDVRAWPWTINADGKGYFFESKAAAVAWAKQGLARGVSFMDVGCMQVDLQMHPKAFRSLDEAFDPTHNVTYGAGYLKRLHDGDAGGNWNIAVGLYHSHTPYLAAAYRNRVAAVGAGILTGFGAPEPLYMTAIRQGTLRLALAGGGSLVLHINRQPARRPHRRMSPCQVIAFLGSDLPAKVRARGCRARAR